MALHLALRCRRSDVLGHLPILPAIQDAGFTELSPDQARVSSLAGGFGRCLPPLLRHSHTVPRIDCYTTYANLNVKVA